MSEFIVAVFVVTYLGMAAGRIPGLKMDRTGIALFGAVAMLALQALPLERIPRVIDFPTLCILFGLMILSAQFAASGFYDWAASRIAAAAGSPIRLLALTVIAAGGLSAVLANDIVVFAMTPLICSGVKARGLDPRPFLAGLAGASNAGSAATLIGNPQNIVIGQVGHLNFWHFIWVCSLPALAALLVTFAVVWLVWREALAVPAAAAAAASQPLDRWQFGKAVLAGLVLVGLFATPVPRELAALVVAAALLVSRRLSRREMISAVDWHLILLFACLFLVNAALAGTGLPAQVLDSAAGAGLLPDRLTVLTAFSVAASNTIGNVPAVVMLLSLWPHASAGVLYALAVLSTLAGNLLLVGSIANLIVSERAALAGVRFGFADHARAGIPMAVLSLLLAVAWFGFGGWLPWH